MSFREGQDEETPDTDKGSPSGLPRQSSTLPGSQSIGELVAQEGIMFTSQPWRVIWTSWATQEQNGVHHPP